MDKDQAFDNLYDLILEIAGTIHSYAHGKTDQTLLKMVNYTPTVLSEMTQEELLTAAGVVLEQAYAIAPESTYNEGILADDVIRFNELIEFAKSIKSSKREAVINRSGSTDKLDQLGKEATELVKNRIDRLALHFKRKAPGFYLKYKAARDI